MFRDVFDDVFNGVVSQISLLGAIFCAQPVPGVQLTAVLRQFHGKDIDAARNIINTAMNQTFGASYRVKAYNAIIPFLRQIRDDA